MVQALLTPNLVELVERESKDSAEKQELLAVLPRGQQGPFSSVKSRLTAVFQGSSKNGCPADSLPSNGQMSFPGWSMET